jgi:intracellular sulfur oxidation DsrE/DsrF family protein
MHAPVAPRRHRRPVPAHSRRALCAAATWLALLPAAGDGQALSPRSTGPVIDGFGGVFEVPGIQFPTDAHRIYRAVFDVAAGAPEVDQVNARIATLARFLNMHARAGVPVANMKLALVLHGTAGKDALGDPAYRERYGIDNPNLPLIHALHDVGVRVILCGQTAQSRGLPGEDLAEPVEMALSAMTALITLQDEGYRLIAF